MKKLLTLCALSLVLMGLTDRADNGWLTDIELAKTEAIEHDKLILLSFSGSDWCGNCIRLEKTLFESESFKTFSLDKLVLFNADFPMRKKNKLSPEQTKKNDALAEEYNKDGVFPTVLILDASGKVQGKLVHPKESAEAYMTQLKNWVK